jgi:hypothetical protein
LNINGFPIINLHMYIINVATLELYIMD